MAKTPDFESEDEGSIPSAPAIFKLVPAKTITEQNRSDAIGKIREVLELAERGEIDEVLIIANAKEEWMNWSSTTSSILKWIGRIEVTKNDWIALYNQEEEKRRK